MRVVLLVLLFGGSVGAADIDFERELLSFGGSGGRFLNDAANAEIVNRCLAGTPVAALRERDPETAQRFDRLTAARVLLVQEGRCAPGFPVITGARRDQLARVVRQAAERLAPKMKVIVAELRRGTGGRDDVLFHLLWSRVMDIGTAWNSAWQQEFGRKPGPPGVSWVLSPLHRLQVGTNYNGVPGRGQIAVTWGARRRDHIAPLMSARADLNRLAWSQPLDEPHQQNLRELGCIGANGRLLVFSFRNGGAEDRLFERLAREYAALLKDAFHFDQLGAELGVPTGELFVIALHEVAYELLATLAEAGQLRVPPALAGNPANGSQTELVSLRLGRQPGSGSPDDQVIEVMEETGWKGTPETVLRLKDLLARNSGNLQAMFYLGISLYDLREYGPALEMFDKLNQAAPEGDWRHAWSHIWAGHMHDLLGQREAAVGAYRQALGARDQRQFAQYRIGPITADAWAKQRIETPFERR